ncbi:uncharacterized protein TNCV_1111471 [Trichonephila clavipes]|nr:uncharacterized protein TNCV_1111471 [Trichonephila clavipes]
MKRQPRIRDLDHYTTVAFHVALESDVDQKSNHIKPIVNLVPFKTRAGTPLLLQISHKDINSTRGLLVTDHVILNHGQVTWTTPELIPPFLTTTPHQREDVSAFDRFNVQRYPTRRVFSGTGLELVTRQATI